MALALIVHGGAGIIPDAQAECHRQGVEAAARTGWKVLQSGGSAVDAVEAAIVVLEDNPVFDAGTGSFLNRDGQVEMDACFMDGKTLQAGAVAGVQHVKNPICLARRVLDSDATFLIAHGAERFAQEIGMPLIENTELQTPERIAEWKEYLASPPAPPRATYVPSHGTVGCVAVDKDANVAAGTSTGGTRFKRVGRVGDSPLVGAGAFADNLLGAASATGWGEAITRTLMSKFAVDALAFQAHPAEAARAAIEYLGRRVGGTGGVILVNPNGEVGFSFNTQRMAYAYWTQDMAKPKAIC